MQMYLNKIRRLNLLIHEENGLQINKVWSFENVAIINKIC